MLSLVRLGRFATVVFVVGFQQSTGDGLIFSIFCFAQT